MEVFDALRTELDLPPSTSSDAFGADVLAEAEAVYTPQWQAYIAERYGAPPDIRYFETAVVVDNDTDTITADAA